MDNSLRTLVVTKFATTPAQACNTKGNKSLRSLRSLRENKNACYLYLTQRTQNFNANYAIAEVVAGYARQRAQRQTEKRKTANAITHFLPLRQATKRVFRRMTRCHSVPSEGRNSHCDVRTTPTGGRGWIAFTFIHQRSSSKSKSVHQAKRHRILFSRRSCAFSHSLPTHSSSPLGGLRGLLVSKVLYDNGHLPRREIPPMFIVA